jgi:gluconokinase
MPAKTGDSDRARVLVVMGVAGSGKSTVGRLLADRLGWVFREGDDLHSSANVAKMRAGIPLSDEDRRPWLNRLAAWVDTRLRAGENGVLTCSALKRSYRDRIGSHGGVVFVYLTLDRDTLRGRLVRRTGHYMPADLLASQLATVEEPTPDEPAIRVQASRPAEAMVEEVLAQLSTCGDVCRPG